MAVNSTVNVLCEFEGARKDSKLLVTRVVGWPRMANSIEPFGVSLGVVMEQRVDTAKCVGSKGRGYEQR